MLTQILLSLIASSVQLAIQCFIFGFFAYGGVRLAALIFGGVGLRGPKGDTGYTGESGPQGEPGLDGRDGKDGSITFIHTNRDPDPLPMVPWCGPSTCEDAKPFVNPPPPNIGDTATYCGGAK